MLTKRPAKIISALIALLAADSATADIGLGVLQHDDARTAEIRAAGIDYTVLELGWNRFEPKPGEYNAAYIAETRAKLEARRAAGFRLCLDLGIQYPPMWALELPNGKYVNQYGDAFVDNRPGHLAANAVFSRPVRDAVERYVRKVRDTFGDDFVLVRLGWGHYGELNFPVHTFTGKTNCYWAFDAAAQAACPVPGWRPGDASPNNEAATFIAWYFDALKIYHDWQIALTRELYPGARLGMMYPSWGVRPGSTALAIKTNLDGSTPQETTGEISRGFDFARFIGGITDTNVVVYCTWIDSSPAFSDEASENPRRWSPPHWLSHLAKTHSPPLRVWGENTGGGGLDALRLTVERARTYDIDVVLWAFEPHLFSGAEPTLPQLTNAFGKAAVWQSPAN